MRNGEVNTRMRLSKSHHRPRPPSSRPRIICDFPPTRWLHLLLSMTIADRRRSSKSIPLLFFTILALVLNVVHSQNTVGRVKTTRRSVPDDLTTPPTPLLTTYRYSNGNDEWLRVDLKNQPSNVDFEVPPERDEQYGSDLEKDHVLPTSAPAADILKNNNNRQYQNPNRYNNDRQKPESVQDAGSLGGAGVTENYKITTHTYSFLRNVRPTKSMYSKDIPSYVPPSRAFFTPPLPPEYQNPFADKPTLRGTNSDGFASRRPIPPPSLMPNKDRIPFRPDLPAKVNAERGEGAVPKTAAAPNATTLVEKKKTLNTPSQNTKLGEFYGLNRSVNESSFEYEKSYAPEPSITRILSGSNGRHDDIQIPDILYRAVTATPNVVRSEDSNREKVQPPPEVKDIVKPVVMVEPPKDRANSEEEQLLQIKPMESVTSKKIVPKLVEEEQEMAAPTTQISDFVNLPNTKSKDTLNVTTKANTEDIWLICWNIHVYLVVFGFIILALFSIYKLIRYENDPHMFSKSYFLTIHLMLTVVCVLRIFYLAYDPYNVNNSFSIFLYEFMHTFPLSLLATTFAVLILFLLKRTLTHLEVKTRPVILVVFALLHIILCISLSIFETFGHFDKASLIVCRPVFVLLTWSLGFSYLYLYRIIKNVLAKKSQNLSEMCTQNISYASHITIAIALLFVLLGFVQLYALFFIKIDRFNGEIKHHWILWGFELSVRFLELSIIILLAIVVSLKMSQREKQSGNGGFPLFPCTTSDSSTDNIYPNNCNSNPNALNYSRNEMMLDSLPRTDIRPTVLKNNPESFERKSTLERRYHSDSEQQQQQRNINANFDRFQQANNRASERSYYHDNGFTTMNSLRGSNSAVRKYYTKPKYDVDETTTTTTANPERNNIYSEPVDNHEYERTLHDFERNSSDDFDAGSRRNSSRNSSSNTSGRRVRKNLHHHQHGGLRAHHLGGVQTLPNNHHDHQHRQFQQHEDQGDGSMLVDEQGFVRFRHMQEEHGVGPVTILETSKPKKKKLLNAPADMLNHFSDA